ncbi:MAG: MOSC domain-containing protein [Pseudomonadota bacterium]|nr:MOSC domain-containing protein [Pseudomonadota bacterium]
MSPASAARVTDIFRFPVKGLGADPLDQVSLSAGETLPLDRAYAVENGPGRFDPENPEHLPKVAFLMLMRNERLAALETRFEEDGHVLTILRNDRQVAKGSLVTPIGRQLIEQFLAGYMGSDLRGAPRIVCAPGHSFTDMSEKCVHIVNLASLRELERALGKPVDPLRFRANFYVELHEPWIEFAWLGQELGLGDARLNVFERTGRCEATAVDPKSGARNMAITAALTRTWGHDDFGVYAKVTAPGRVSRGSSIEFGKKGKLPF